MNVKIAAINVILFVTTFPSYALDSGIESLNLARLEKPVYNSLIGTWYQLFYSSEGSGWNRGRFESSNHGRYSSSDEEIYKYHLKLLVYAGVDFVIIDATNGIWGSTQTNIPKFLKFVDNQPLDKRVGVAIAIGSRWFSREDENGNNIKGCPETPEEWEKARQDMDKDAEMVFKEYVENYSSYFHFEGKPLLINYDANCGEGADWNHEKFFVAPATGNIQHMINRGHDKRKMVKERGLWGWGASKNPYLHDFAVHTVPGWSLWNGNSWDEMTPRGNAGETLINQLYAAIIKDPKVITVGSINAVGEETLLEPAKFSENDERPEVKSYAKDYYGNETPDLYWQILRAYSLLRWGFGDGLCYMEKDRGDVFCVENGKLVYKATNPKRKPVILVPPTTLDMFAPGVFKVADSPAVYYSNGASYCLFGSMNQLKCMTKGERDPDKDFFEWFQELPKYPTKPSRMNNDGWCEVPDDCLSDREFIIAVYNRTACRSPGNNELQ